MKKKISITIVYILIVSSFVSVFSIESVAQNQPPLFGTPSPENNSINNPLNFTWSIPINDSEGNIFNWTIQCSNGQNNSASGVVNGTKSLTLTGLTYLTPYTIWVNATDPTGSNLYTRGWYSFMTVTAPPPNQPPLFGTPTPANGSTGNPLGFTWSIPINDIEGDVFNWTIQCNNGQTNSNIGDTNGTKSLSLIGLAYSTTYTIWVNAIDPKPNGSGSYTNKSYTFTTKSYNAGGGGGGTSPSEPQNKKPIANVSAGEPYQGFVNTPILFNGTRSIDPDGNITKWLWVFGDNTNGTGIIVSHNYSKIGTYTVTLTVIDNKGAANTDTTKCVIKQRNGSITSPIITGNTTGTKNTIYKYTANSTDTDNDAIQYTFDWGDSISQSSGF